MRGFFVCFVVLVSLIAGCGGIDSVVDGSVPDSGQLLGDGGPFAGDAGVGDTGMVLPGVDGGDLADAGLTDAGLTGDDAAVSASDASVVTGTCGNAVLDPGEACDPGHVVRDDGGTRVVVSAADRAFCPDADCGRVACPSSVGMYGGPVDNRYCVYYVAPTATVPAGARSLLWGDQRERDAQFTVLRAAMAAQGAASWSGSIGLHRSGTCVAPGSNACPAGSPAGASCRPTATTTGVCAVYGGFGSPSPTTTRCEPVTCTWSFGTGSAPVALPPWATTRFLSPSPEDCSDMTLTSGGALMGQTICGGVSSEGDFVIIDPPGV